MTIPASTSRKISARESARPMRTTRPRARKWVEERKVERFWGLLLQ